MNQAMKTGLIGIFAAGAMMAGGCDRMNFDNDNTMSRFEQRIEAKQNALVSAMPEQQVGEVTRYAALEDLKKGVYTMRFVEDGDTLDVLVNIIQTTHHHKNAVVTDVKGSGDLSAVFGDLSKAKITPVALPDALQELQKGVYEVTAQLNGAENRCTASVIQTTHGQRNVLLSNCRPAAR